ncbi:FAD binding domain protein [Xylona heveae TC161]|uniref:FAD binding domain protein n=1 Tax=Xylona heveae (strain CBS 132557 / TC161) TaxID=1328760 RepID=A0A165HFS0_XYLHT|nr:FAD binding domain protein [Xylona heveae TC161]KZF23445.1 FAD binding domain protein [Xylona heveae TC161]
MTAPSSIAPILIIGAGISGLTLAQALRKNNIPFEIFERDASPESRGTGWGLTIHWALQDFYELLPQQVVDRLPETYVNRAAVERGENGNFMFFDLSNGEEKCRVPPNKRIRVSREKLRKVLMDGVDVKWSKKLADINIGPDSVTASFDDGTSYKGSMLVGCDGSRSRVRQNIYPTDYTNYMLPIRMLGIKVKYPEAKVKDIMALDPYFLSGSDPRTDFYLWFSFLETPSDAQNGTDEYICQIMVSWPFRPGFYGFPDPLEVPKDPSERLALIKKLVDPWKEPFRSIIQDLPDDTEPAIVNLQDWILPAIDQGKGRVTLIGDAAHPMTMYRGEAANHAIADIMHLLTALKEHSPRTFTLPTTPNTHHTSNSTATATATTNGVSPSSSRAPSDVDTAAIHETIKAYETEMASRGRTAVLYSRQACLDAHEWDRIGSESPLLARRVMKPIPLETAQKR